MSDGFTRRKLSADGTKWEVAAPLPAVALAADLCQRINALAARCEVEEPSRDLDCAIAKAMGWTIQQSGYFLDWYSPEGVTGPEVQPSFYTASLDAAVTLVPEGFRWVAGPLPMDRGGANASVWRDSRNPKECAFNIEGRTPALAICAAALRARAVLIPKQEGHADSSPEAAQRRSTSK